MIDLVIYDDVKELPILISCDLINDDIGIIDITDPYRSIFNRSGTKA